MSHKKKILYLALCDPDLSVTGVTVRMGAFVRHLSEHYDITLVNMTGSGHKAKPLPGPTSIDKAVTHRVQVPFSQAGYFLFSRQLYRAAKQLLEENTYDYLVADYGLAAVYGVLLSKRYHLPLLYFSSNVEYRMYLELGRHDLRRLLLMPYVYWAEKTACRRAYRVVTVSERDRYAYAKWTKLNKIISIPQGFNPKEMNPFYSAPPDKRPVVLFTGSFRDENNRQAARYIAKELAPQVAKVIPDVVFQLVGSDPPKDLAGPTVECLGFVENITPVVRRATVVVAPMPFGHGISTKVVMSLAYGKAVLTTPQVAGGMPREYEQLRVAPIEQFAQKLIEMLKMALVVSDRGFETLCQDLAWPDLIERLHFRIEHQSEYQSKYQSEYQSERGEEAPRPTPTTTALRPSFRQREVLNDESVDTAYSQSLTLAE